MDRTQLISIKTKLGKLIEHGTSFLSNYSKQRDGEFDEWCEQCLRVLAQSDKYGGTQDAAKFKDIPFSPMIISMGDTRPEDYNVWLYPGVKKGLKLLGTVLRDIENDLEIDKDVNKLSNDPADKVVFVIHGRNERRKDALFDWLRSLHLHPLEWEEVVALTGNASSSTFAVVQKGLEVARAVIAMFTDDEEVALRPELRESAMDAQEGYQARANVIFEAGMACAAGGEKRTIFLEWGDCRRFTDIEGINNVRFGQCPTAVTLKTLKGRLEVAGCKPVDSGDDWLKTRRFEDAADLPTPKF